MAKPVPKGSAIDRKRQPMSGKIRGIGRRWQIQDKRIWCDVLFCFFVLAPLRL
jgi:hypothetical protein